MSHSAEERLVRELTFWERYRSQLKGSRSQSDVWRRTLEVLSKEFSPGECFLAVSENASGKWKVVGWRSRNLGEAKQPSSPTEKRLLLQWGKLMDQTHKQGRALRQERDGRVSLLCPIELYDSPRGILVLADSSLSPLGMRLVQAVAQEMEEWLRILQENQAKVRERIDELESMLVEVTQEVEKRSKELELMTERWLSVKRFNESVLESLGSGLIALGSDGLIHYFNRGAEKILQYSAEEVLGKPLGVAMASKDKRNLLVVEGMEDEPFLGRQILVMRKDGTEIPVGIYVASHLDKTGSEIGKIINFRDLTKMKEMQEELLRIGRLGSLGEVSMGIAHEIRNPLAGIRITAQAMGEEVKDNPALNEYASRIITEIDRLNELVKSFLSFAKPQKPQLVSCNLPELLQDVLFLVKKDLERGHIQVEQDHAENLPSVEVDVNQMKQVLLNLLLNSIQSITKGGEIHLRTSVISHGDRRELVVTVSDTGKGIPPDLQAKIFDPFFTTKAKGLGMGLSNTYRIVKGHHGHIKVQSELGKGTTFFIQLPLEDEKKK